MTKPNDQAFPIVNPEVAVGGQVAHGPTKREIFAAMAMQGLIGNSENLRFFNEKKIPAAEVRAGIAKTAVQFADALIAEFAKGDSK